VEVFAQDLHNAVETLGINGFNLVGHSMGGATVAQYALAHQDRLKSLTLLNSAPLKGRDLPKGWDEPIREQFRSGALPQGDMGFQAPHVTEEFKSYVLEDIGRNPVERALAGRPTMSRLRLRSRLDEIRVPTLVVGGDRDDTVDIDNILADYLALPREEAPEYLPFVWGVDRHRTLQRLVISRTLVHACRDRLDFWHNLQELSGTRNRYVEQAVSRVREETTAEAEARIARLRAEQEQALAAARAEAAATVMGRLTEVLMGMDFTGDAAQPRLAAAPTANRPEPGVGAAGGTEPVTEGEEEAEVEAGPASEEDEIGGFDEPWIDSPLCTSCNDCLAINPIMFVYNENNQAIIADAASGTYAQLVEAAEICPSKCIHPGTPLNPDEPGVAELLERAAAFD